MREPREAVLRPVYARLVALLTGVGAEPTAARFSCLDALEHRELHAASLDALDFVRAVVRLAHVAGFHDFSTSDLTHPEYKRTRRALSAIINFAKFREERLGRYADETAAAEGLVQRREQLESRRATLAAQAAAAKRAAAADENAAAEQERAARGLQTAINAANQRQAALQADIRKAKAADGEVAARVAAAKSSAASLASEVDRLSAQIVTSPDKARSQIEELASQLSTARDAKAAAQRAAADAAERLAAYTSLDKDMSRCLELAEQAAREVTKLDRLDAETATYASALDAAEGRLREFEAALARARAGAASVEEKSARLASSAVDRKQEALAQLHAARRAKAEKEKDRLENASMQSQHAIVARQMEAKTEALRQSHQTNMAALSTRFEQLLAAVRAYQKDVRDAVTAQM